MAQAVLMSSPVQANLAVQERPLPHLVKFLETLHPSELSGDDAGTNLQVAGIVAQAPTEFSIPQFHFRNHQN